MPWAEFHFIRSEALLALVPLAILAWVWIKRTRSGSGWEATVDDELLEVLLEGGGSKARQWHVWLLLGVLTLGVLGVAGPTWQKLPQNVEQKQDSLIIVLDLSLSMLAEDVKPSRIERARQEIADVLRTREEGQTGMIVYAGDAHSVVPLTDDTGTIENLLFSLGPEMMPVYGSNPNHALTLAQELFANARVLQGRILLITDGIDEINSVSRHRNRAFPISVLGIGTPEGAPIPLDKLRQPGRFLQSQEGNRIIAMLDETRLRDVAELTYGNYAVAVVGDADIEQALSVPLPGDDETIEVEREFDTWADQGHWLALLLLPVMLWSFRKGILIVVVFAIGLPAPQPAMAEDATSLGPAGQNDLVDAVAEDAARALIAYDNEPAWWQSLWLRDDQRGYRLLREGQPEKASAVFQDPQWQSIAQYRTGEYTSALSGFSLDESLTGLYNQGNSLARLGEYEAAIDHYAAVLDQQPQHEDAQFNKQLVENLLKEQQEAQQQQEDQQESEANNEQSESQQDDQQQQDQSEQEQPGDEQQEQEQEQQQQDNEQQEGEEEQAEQNEEDQASRDEKQEALEQWLRRVPDDPGGLMRRKFSHETKQRLRRGEYENREGDKLW